MTRHTVATARNTIKGISTARIITVVLESPSLRIADWVGITVELVPVGGRVSVTLTVTTSAGDKLDPVL